MVQGHLTLKYERVAKIMKVATISAAIKTIVRCSALAPVDRTPLRPARQERYERVPKQVLTRYSRHKTVAATYRGCQLLTAQRHERRP